MKYYFFSPIRSALFADGAPTAVLDNNLFFFETDSKVNFEIRSFCDFELCRALSCAPEFDENIKRYSFYGGEMLIPDFKRKLRRNIALLFEKRTSVFGAEYVVNAHIDGFFKLSVQGCRDCVTVPIRIEPKGLEVFKHDSFIVVEAKDRLKNVFVFGTEPLKLLSSIVCDDYALSDVLSITKRKRGVSEYIVREHYGFSGGFSLLGKDLISKKPANFIKNRLLNSQFFLEIAIFGGDITPFLGANIRNEAKKIAEFIGGASHVFPPCEKDRPETFSILGDSVKYAKIFYENDKIIDIDIRNTPF